jgi:hypothetical protein
MKLALGCFISFFAFLILCIIIGAFYPAMTPSEPPKAAPPNAIDYDWNTGKYILPADTVELMRNPYGRGWIRKDTFKIIQKVKPITR